MDPFGRDVISDPNDSGDSKEFVDISTYCFVAKSLSHFGSMITETLAILVSQLALKTLFLSCRTSEVSSKEVLDTKLLATYSCRVSSPRPMSLRQDLE